MLSDDTRNHRWRIDPSSPLVHFFTDFKRNESNELIQFDFLGRRNYRYFLQFLLLLCLHMILLLIFCLSYLLNNQHYQDVPNSPAENDIHDALVPTSETDLLTNESMKTIFIGFSNYRFILSICILILLGILIIPIVAFTGFHLYLVSQGRTTNEQVKRKYGPHQNAFTDGFFKNFLNVFCRSASPQWKSPSKKRYNVKEFQKMAYGKRRIQSNGQSARKIAKTTQNDVKQKKVEEKVKPVVKPIEIPTEQVRKFLNDSIKSHAHLFCFSQHRRRRRHFPNRFHQIRLDHLYLLHQESIQGNLINSLYVEVFRLCRFHLVIRSIISTKPKNILSMFTVNVNVQCLQRHSNHRRFTTNTLIRFQFELILIVELIRCNRLPLIIQRKLLFANRNNTKLLFEKKSRFFLCCDFVQI